jgi:hypothetical protein
MTKFKQRVKESVSTGGTPSQHLTGSVGCSFANVVFSGSWCRSRGALPSMGHRNGSGALSSDTCSRPRCACRIDRVHSASPALAPASSIYVRSAAFACRGVSSCERRQRWSGKAVDPFPGPPLRAMRSLTWSGGTSQIRLLRKEEDYFLFSKRVAIRRKCLRLEKQHSIRLRCLYRALQ